MKQFTITNAKQALETGDNEDKRKVKFEIEGDEDMECSDGYHTFEELYEHRITLFTALCSMRANVEDANGNPFFEDVWRSKLHSDGTMFDGWFIMGIGTEKGEQITYHLPIEKWDLCECAEELERAPEWDGHTPTDVLERLKKL